MHGTAAGTPVPLTSFGGLVTLASPDSLPEGASPRTYDTDFLVGSAGTRPGLNPVYSYANSSVGPNGPELAVSPTWRNTGNLTANDGSYTSVQTTRSPVPLGYINASEFGFNLPATITPTGITVTLYGYSNSSSQLRVQLTVNGAIAGVTKTVAMPMTRGAMVLGGPGDTWGVALSSAVLNNAKFGLQIFATSNFALATAFLDYATIQAGVTTANANFNFITTFTAQNGAIKNLSLDANGDFWVEDVSNNPGELTLALTGITPNSSAVGVNGPDVEYLAFNNGFTGSDIPRQYTPQWTDRITQVGPGASPIFSAQKASGTSYPVVNIVQPAAVTWGFAFGLQSAGPGSGTPGSTVTIYYADSTVTGQDTDLVNAFNSGNATYLYLNITASSGGDTTGALTTPYTALITSVGIGNPNGQARPFYYFTYQVATTEFIWNPGQNGFAVTYQRTLATLTTSTPVPGVTVGSSIAVTGNSVTTWNANWSVTQTPKSGSMAITQTALSTSGVGTYSYTVLQGANPAAGQLVTVTGTLNGDGALNVVDDRIASVTGTTTGTFTINLLPGGTAYPAQPENGQAVTAGTVFCFDPGIATWTTGTSPIYGNGTGGDIVFSATGQFIGPGTRQGTVFFITRNSYWTAPGPPVTFSCPSNTSGILAAQLPIGPPNVIARGIAFTEAGQNGVPGANFFTIPNPVQYIVENVTYTCSSFLINDNTTTEASFFFTDSVLLAAEAIDTYGYNLFNQIEIGNPGWIASYDGRNFYGLCQNKIQNFLNLSFDGGFLNASSPKPLGWTAPGPYGKLLVSPVFGNSYYIQNTTAGALNGVGLIAQGAYQDAYQVPIIEPNTGYSVRVTVRSPSGATAGNLIVWLESGGNAYPGYFDLGFNRLTTEFQTITGTLLTAPFTTVPANLQLQVLVNAMAAGADVEIDRIEVFDTAIPILTTTVYGSYAGLAEQVDGVTGQVGVNSENQQPVNGAQVMYDTLYLLKQSSLYSLQASPNLEPADWQEPEVAQRAGACGINAFDFGEQWMVMACRNGLYLFEGGQPGKIMQEIFQVWDAIHWNAAQTIWVRNDVVNRRLMVGVPMATPNFWLPNAPVVANPTSPNVILMLNYQGLDTGHEMQAAPQMHTTMFGTLTAVDMRRKWSIWQIPSPYAATVKTATDQAIYICNGRQNSQVYALDAAYATDDGMPINALYTTYGFVNASKAATFPMLGMFRKLWGYMTMTASGAGTLNVRMLPNVLVGPDDDTTGYNPSTVPGGFLLQENCLNDQEASLNFSATRTYVEFTGTKFNLSALTLYGKKNTWNALRGSK